jgi:basic membrane protein A
MFKNLMAAVAAVCFSALACAASPLAPSAKASSEAAAPPLKVAFVYVTPIGPTGWVHQHELARQQLQATLGSRVSTSYVADVPEGADAERVIRDLARQGNKLIFTPSFGYMEPTLKVARDFPDVKFESITGYKTAANVAVANARYYEGRYLAGIAAGRMTRTNIAGYVAGFPIPEVLRGINAFTLGMRSVNPKAVVKLIWLDTWFDPPKERDAAMTLVDQGADVLTFHTGSDAVMVAAEERGVMAVAYHSDMRAVAPHAQIASIQHLWGDYVVGRARAVLDGTWRPTRTWGGVKDGMIRVGNFGPKVPKAVQQEVLAREHDISDGRLQPFRAGADAVRDNTGQVRIPAGTTLDDTHLMTMDWLVEGVQGRP